MICCGVTPCLGVSMTSTSVVLGIATLGTPEALPDWDCATDAAGITAIRNIASRKGITKFIRLSSLIQFDSFHSQKSTLVLLKDKNFYSSAKDFMKKFLASRNRCSRF